MTNILYCVNYENNSELYYNLFISIYSLYKNNQNDSLRVIIFFSNLKQKTIEDIGKIADYFNRKIEFIQICEETTRNKFKFIRDFKRFGVGAFYRIMLDKLPKNISKIIYLDCDTIVQSGIKDLFNTNLKDNSIGGVEDKFSTLNLEKLKEFNLEKYINSGILLIDVEKVKTKIEHETFEDIKDKIKNSEVLDQDLINLVFKNDILLLNKNFNSQDFVDYGIIHYCGNKIYENPVQSLDNKTLTLYDELLDKLIEIFDFNLNKKKRSFLDKIYSFLWRKTPFKARKSLKKTPLYKVHELVRDRKF